ncbi:MAG: hypothetical protein GY777_11645 [Candidatus Brocadiaceae bacterium]|nr:hypothetical protein [Candidatus Brocadiaceae bacterium]
MNFTDSDIEQRKPVWIALSDLFLDTDVTLCYSNIIHVCSKSPYSVETLRNILCEEVTPVVSSNLLGIAGEWAGFNEEWLVESIIKRIRSKKSIRNKYLKLFPNIVFNRYAKKHWNRIESKIEFLRKNA